MVKKKIKDMKNKLKELIIMNEKDMISKGYYCSEENAKIIESILKRNKKRIERIM